jgi:hypothetical protein
MVSTATFGVVQVWVFKQPAVKKFFNLPIKNPPPTPVNQVDDSKPKQVFLDPKKLAKKYQNRLAEHTP